MVMPHVPPASDLVWAVVAAKAEAHHIFAYLEPSQERRARVVIWADRLPDAPPHHPFGHPAPPRVQAARVASSYGRTYRRPPLLLPLRPQLAGADALGVSLDKRHRWAMLGGHGRHGAG